MPGTRAVALPTKPPIYQRQRFLLELLRNLDSKVTATDLQKVVFLYFMNTNPNDPHYEFVPYKFGPYSFQLAQDVEVLCKCGYIHSDNTPTTTDLPCCGIQIDTSAIELMRGESLIRKTYKTYPYYAIKSKIIETKLDTDAQDAVHTFSKELENETQLLLSIGYEGKKFESFISILLLNGIKLLCDVRRNPISRKFGFSIETLQHALNNVDIQYKHIPELGIESEKRQLLDTQDDYDRLFNEYRSSLPQRQDALNYVHSLFARSHRIALMCYEQDPLCCHRTIIKDYLIDKHGLNSKDL